MYFWLLLQIYPSDWCCAPGSQMWNEKHVILRLYLLHNPVFAGGKVIFRCINERDSEVKHQVDEQRAGVLRQKHLREMITRYNVCCRKRVHVSRL